MRFLADENFPGDAVAALRAAGHDVAWIRLEMPGSSDRDVLHRAMADARILVTFDKDFGELAWRFGLSAECGVVLFRLPMRPPTDLGATITAVLAARADWAGHLSVIQSDRIRMRRLPRVPSTR